ncbi:hypothetical protein RclHR1_08410002 [Rhizophagus clarus]|uniref:Uncharacterized protein n=1 Tax=Rhizophagus clarus TaxID=94130 RepID=A0A2Z6SNF3_9GLOM|nr:hypothetical protein RclHR1_08410002 [Rhizophagus clarus]GES81532.1 hypothetical protein RCL_jg4739.t1 [Rhizophagus clarus]
MFFRSLRSSLTINLHILLNKTEVNKLKKLQQIGLFEKTERLKPLITPVIQRKLNNEIMTVICYYLRTALALSESQYPKKQKPPKIGNINNVSTTLELAIIQKMDMDILSPAQHQSNPVAPSTHAELTPKGKGKKKNKNKKVPTVDPDFADSLDKKPAQNVYFSTLLPSSPKESANNKASTSSVPILDLSDNEKKKQKMQK